MSWRENLLFLRKALRHYKEVGMPLPTGARLAEAVAQGMPRGIRRAVELGAGTGAVSRHLLARLAADGRLFCVEKDPDFCGFLRRDIKDPRVEVIQAAAEDLPALRPDLFRSPVDAVVLCLAPRLASLEMRARWAAVCRDLLADGGSLVVEQFRPVMAGHFSPPKWRVEDRRWVPGLPPFRVDRLVKIPG